MLVVIAGLDPAIHEEFRSAPIAVMDYRVSQHHPLAVLAGCCGLVTSRS
jgi:hypothetical protein